MAGKKRFVEEILQSNFNFSDGPRDMAKFKLRGEDPAKVRRRRFDSGDRYVYKISHEER